MSASRVGVWCSYEGASVFFCQTLRPQDPHWAGQHTRSEGVHANIDLSLEARSFGI